MTRRLGRALPPVLLLAPGVLLFALFVVYPIVASCTVAFYRWDGVNAPDWVGLANFVELAADPAFHTALANNLLWLALSPLAPLLGLAIALLVSHAVAGIRIIRSLFFMPFVMSQVVVGLVFAWFLNAHFGLLNAVLAMVGLPAAAPLDSERWSIVAVIAAGLWPQSAYCAILYLTGLTALRPEPIEAARIDGAEGWTLFWHVVLPQLRPVTFIVAMVCIVNALRSFDLVVIMTGGGPYGSSTVLAHYMMEQTFYGLRYGYGAAIAVVQFLLMGAGVGFFLWRMLRRERD